MKIAINQHHVGKMPNDLSSSDIKSWWREFNGGFKNFDLPSVDHLIWAIQEGYAYTAQHNGYRRHDNFLCGQHVGLDFDTGDERSSFATLTANKYIRKNASFIHTTPSYTDDEPRTRVVFVLEQAIYTKKKYSILTEAFANKFATSVGADPSCKDPVRLFFGSKDCRVQKLGNVLSVEAAAEVVIPYKEQKRRNRSVSPSARHGVSGNGSGVLKNLMTKLQLAPDGQKWHTLVKVSRTLGGYVGAGYFEQDYIEDLLLQTIAPRASDLDIAEEAIMWGVLTGMEEPLYMDEDRDPVIQSMFR